MSDTASSCTIEVSTGSFYEVSHTPKEVREAIDTARRRQVGKGQQRLHLRPDLVVLKYLSPRGGKSDAAYRDTINLNPDMVVAILPLDERPMPIRMTPIDRVDAALGQ